MINVVGLPRAQRLLQLGSLITPTEAHNIGLVDELVADKTELMARAEDKYVLDSASLVVGALFFIVVMINCLCVVVTRVVAGCRITSRLTTTRAASLRFLFARRP